MAERGSDQKWNGCNNRNIKQMYLFMKTYATTHDGSQKRSLVKRSIIAIGKHNFIHIRIYNNMHPQMPKYFVKY